MNREPESTQYPLTMHTSNGEVTVLRHRQIYQHIQLKVSYKVNTHVDYVWITLADNCDGGFAVCDDRMPDNVERFMRYVAGSWISHWEQVTR